MARVTQQQAKVHLWGAAGRPSEVPFRQYMAKAATTFPWRTLGLRETTVWDVTVWAPFNSDRPKDFLNPWGPNILTEDTDFRNCTIYTDALDGSKLQTCSFAHCDFRGRRWSSRSDCEYSNTVWENVQIRDGDFSGDSPRFRKGIFRDVVLEVSLRRWSPRDLGGA